MPDGFLAKALLSTIGPVVTLLLAALVGQRVTAYWGERQKRRELELSLANSFYVSYGEFCAIWKSWNHSLKELAGNHEALEGRREGLRDRACKAEGGLEAALLKVAAERVLTKGVQTDLGNLRQAYKVLRKRIEERGRVSYGYSDHPDYLEFKRLSTLFGVLLASRPGRQPSPEEAHEAFREITDNRHEPRWKLAGREQRR